MSRHPRIVIIGAGNVATHLAPALDKTGHVTQVMSRHIDHAQAITDTLQNAQAIDDLRLIDRNADLYVVSIKDDAIAPLMQQIGHADGLWVHTSGSVPASVFINHADKYGVLYPLQTFSRETPVKVNEIPFFVEGSTAVVENSIKDVALSLSPNVYHADSDLRKQLHVAAVFASNFTCHLWALADEILQDANLPFSVLMPLIQASVDKIKRMPAADGLTGPARRGDRGIIEAHLNMLSGDKADIYRLLSESILHRYHHLNSNEKI